MTIDSEDNQPAWTVIPMILCLVFGAGAIGVGGYVLLVRGRVAFLSRRTQWLPVTGAAWQPLSGRQFLRVAGGDPNPAVLRVSVGSSIPALAGVVAPYDISLTQQRTVLVRPADGPVAVTRRPRGDAQQAKWLRVAQETAAATSRSSSSGAAPVPAGPIAWIYRSDSDPQPGPGAGRHATR